MSRAPRRLDGVSYVGPNRYFLTFCARYRRPLFSATSAAELIVQQILRSSVSHQFQLVAYVVMPDHVHALVHGVSDDADLELFVTGFKRDSSRRLRPTALSPVWQRGYYERVLRHDEASVAVIRYILENPIRAGLTRELGEYPWAASAVYSMAELLTAWEEHPSRWTRP